MLYSNKDGSSNDDADREESVDADQEEEANLSSEGQAPLFFVVFRGPAPGVYENYSEARRGADANCPITVMENQDDANHLFVEEYMKRHQSGESEIERTAFRANMGLPFKVLAHFEIILANVDYWVFF
ncbi:unnamed protein product [Cyclocybe aegerita]|uniref:Uncharacterized protein n=1 Tax=Cyclocybe aegerita TaxID=1973307 RepID=A0A8S0VYA7_CYCAE|nr:unnamed protein product [Cyclocybe aegerita]